MCPAGLKSLICERKRWDVSCYAIGRRLDPGVTLLWAVFYLPDTPSFAVLEMKLAIDNRDGNWATQFVDFQSVVRNAEMQMVQNQTANADPLTEFIGKGAVQLLSAPAAQMAASWAKQKVDDGAKEVQMPAAAVAGAMVLLHHSGPPLTPAFTIAGDNNGTSRWRGIPTVNGRWSRSRTSSNCSNNWSSGNAGGSGPIRPRNH